MHNLCLGSINTSKCVSFSDLLEHIQQKGLKPAPVAAVPSPAAAPSMPCAPPRPAAGQSPPAGAGATAAAPVPAGQAYVDIELTNMRKTIAQRLTESKVSGPVHCHVRGVLI